MRQSHNKQRSLGQWLQQIDTEKPGFNFQPNFYLSILQCNVGSNSMRHHTYVSMLLLLVGHRAQNPFTIHIKLPTKNRKATHQEMLPTSQAKYLNLCLSKVSYTRSSSGRSSGYLPFLWALEFHLLVAIIQYGDQCMMWRFKTMLQHGQQIIYIV